MSEYSLWNITKKLEFFCCYCSVSFDNIIHAPHQDEINYRDTFSRPPCTLVQPSMHDVSVDTSDVPDFGIF